MDIDKLNTLYENSKVFEKILFKHNPLHEKLNSAVEIVKKFIAKNNLIIYGGTAIDMALRLHGDKIYPDDEFPDLDFYSTNNVKHSYMLADELYLAGFEDVRTINASHMKTMKVDLIDGHFVADISFQPEEIFNKIPTLVFNGMKFVNPLFQRIDTHSALSFPYDGAPREAIFARWKKDIKRFNKMDKYYPVDDYLQPIVTIPWKRIKIPIEHIPGLFNGCLAYGIIYNEFKKLQLQLHGDFTSDKIVPVDIKIDSTMIEFDTIGGVELISFDIKKAAVKLDIADPVCYEPIGSVLLPRIEGFSKQLGTDVTIYSSKNRMLSTNSISIDNKGFRFTNIQFLMRYFLSKYFTTDEASRDVYLMLYRSLLEMIKVVSAEAASATTANIFFPAIAVYGNMNIDLAREVNLNRLFADIDNTPRFVTPVNYYPGRSIPAKRYHPEFDPESSYFFREKGRISAECEG